MWSRRETVLLVLAVLPLAVLLLAVPPIPQDPAYHELADTRTLFGIPNFQNVLSNVPFLLVGLAGAMLCVRSAFDGARRSWGVFFIGTALAAAGSAYYHWAPDDAALAWDRAPMTIAFMGLLSALVAEHVASARERVLLPLTTGLGVASVLWWRATDDLRLYAWVQFAPLLAILFLLAAYPARHGGRRYVACGLVAYVLAKIAEAADGALFEATSHVVSGHTVKHLLAAAAPLAIYVMLRKRSLAGRFGRPATRHA